MIADFGIALAVSNAGGARVTQTGLSLGTPQYMSPEQATGDKVIDARSDIYSLAAMTYEMLTGEPPHGGSSAQAIIAKLLTEEVRPLTVLRRTVPEHVDAAVRHGLEKLAADRFASAAEFAAALSGARPFTIPGRAAGGSGPGARGVASLSAGMRTLFAALAVAAIGGTSAAAWLATRPAPGAAPMVFDIGLPDSVRLYAGGGSKLALSRDGTKLVFVGVRKGKLALYLRRLSDPVAQEIRGSEDVSSSSNVSPAISPDGEWVAFERFENGRSVLKKLPIAGGTAQILADSGASVRWGAPDVIVYHVGGGGIWTGTPDGRAPRRVASPDSARGIFGLSWPDLLPGGTHALVSLRTTTIGPPSDSMRLGLVSLTDGTVTDLGVRGIFPRYVTTGHIVFSRPPGLVLVAPFSLSERRITGPEVVLLENTWMGTGGAGGFAVSENGTLAFHTGDYGVRSNLVAVDLRGAERLIPGEQRDYLRPRVSPDGARILVTIAEASTTSGSVALIDAETGATQSLASTSSGYLGAWTRDGVNAVLARRNGQVYDIVSRPWDGRAGDTMLARDLSREVVDLSLGPSGGFSAVVLRQGAFGSDLFIAPTDSLGTMRPFAGGGSQKPAVSPNGRLVAWVIRGPGSGPSQVFVSALPGPGPRVQVSVSGGSGPIWNDAGTRLYFRGPDRIMVADLAQAPLRVTKRDSLFEDRYVRDSDTDVVRNWDLIPGRSEFLMVKLAGQQQPVPRVLLNWPQRLAAPGDKTPPPR